MTSAVSEVPLFCPRSLHWSASNAANIDPMFSLCCLLTGVLAFHRTQRKSSSCSSCQTFSAIHRKKRKKITSFHHPLLSLYVSKGLEHLFKQLFWHVMFCFWIFIAMKILLKYNPVPLQRKAPLNIDVFQPKTQRRSDLFQSYCLPLQMCIWYSSRLKKINTYEYW